MFLKTLDCRAFAPGVIEGPYIRPMSKALYRMLVVVLLVMLAGAPMALLQWVMI